MKKKDDEFGLYVMAGFIILICAVAIITLLGGWSAIWGRELGKFNEKSRRQIYQESAAEVLAYRPFAGEVM